MQFQVPQFVDISPKIIGPLTLRQFLYLAGAGSFIFVLSYFIQFWLWIIIAVILGLISVGLAFGKFNGMPMAKIAKAAVFYLWRPRFYLWKKEGIVSVKPLRSSSPLSDLFLKISTSRSPIGNRERQFKFFNSERESVEEFRKTTGEMSRAKRIDYR